MKIQVRKPYFPNSSRISIHNEIENLLKSGRLTLGPKVKKLEKDFSRFLGVKYAVAVSSATAGLHLSLLSLDIGNDDEVIVPAKTFISTANSALFCNAKPIFVDVEESTFQLDPKKLEKAITKKTKAVMPVHLGGNVCNMKEILKITKQYNLKVVEDAAHAHGSKFCNKYAGTFGDLGVFSFYPDKVMASSDGGIIVTNNKKLYNKLLLLRNVGRAEIGKYDYTEIGYNYRMNEIQAVLALEQLKILPHILKIRREIAKKYNEVFTNHPNIEIQKISENVESSYYAYVVKVKKGNFNQFRKKLLKNGIETSPMFQTVYKTKIYKKIFKNLKICKISEDLDDKTFSIPLHPGLTKKEIDYIIKHSKSS